MNKRSYFKNGLALVEWTLYPDGRYFMDEDGFGMEDDDESMLYGCINTRAEVVIPFQADYQKVKKEIEERTAV